MSDSDVILCQKNGPVLHITLNRPEVLNALNADMERALVSALTRLRDDEELLVAVLIGAGGRAFSAGMDLKEQRAQKQSEDDGTSLPRFADLELWKPVIAAIDGYCVGGGFEVALQCDIRIATSQSTFGLPEPRWNMIANYYGCHNLSRMIPLGEAFYIQLTGNRINAQDALRCGLVHSVHSDRVGLMEEADLIAEAITRCSPSAVQAIKRLVLKGRQLPIEEAYAMGESIKAYLETMEDTAEGVRAFSEKRQPRWKMK